MTINGRKLCSFQLFLSHLTSIKKLLFIFAWNSAFKAWFPIHRYWNSKRRSDQLSYPYPFYGKKKRLDRASFPLLLFFLSICMLCGWTADLLRILRHTHTVFPTLTFPKIDSFFLPLYCLLKCDALQSNNWRVFWKGLSRYILEILEKPLTFLSENIKSWQHCVTHTSWCCGWLKGDSEDWHRIDIKVSIPWLLH